VQQLQNYSQDFHPKIQYLTGTKEQVAKASKAYRVYFSKANENENDDTDYLVDHSIVFYLLDPAGEFVDFFTQRMQVGDMIEKVQQAQVKWDRQIKETAAAAAAEAKAAASNK
jgi:protein SCO1/2